MPTLNTDFLTEREPVPMTAAEFLEFVCFGDFEPAPAHERRPYVMLTDGTREYEPEPVAPVIDSRIVYSTNTGDVNHADAVRRIHEALLRTA